MFLNPPGVNSHRARAADASDCRASGVEENSALQRAAMPFDPNVETALDFHDQHTSSRTPLPQFARGSTNDDDASELAWLADALQPFLTGAEHVAPGALIMTRAVRPDGVGGDPTDEIDARRLPHDIDAEQVVAMTMGGAASSVVGKYEGIDPAVRPAFASRVLAAVNTLHLYASGPSASALALHADSHDVTILGVSGEKRWTVCSPPDGGTWVALPWEARTNLLQRCGTPDTAALDCRIYTVREGDLLYIPRGHAHLARAAAQGSAHLTIADDPGELAPAARAWRAAACALARRGDGVAVTVCALVVLFLVVARRALLMVAARRRPRAKVE